MDLIYVYYPLLILLLFSKINYRYIVQTLLRFVNIRDSTSDFRVVRVGKQLKIIYPLCASDLNAKDLAKPQTRRMAGWQFDQRAFERSQSPLYLHQVR
jgi:hypothetical protein